MKKSILTVIVLLVSYQAVMGQKDSIATDSIVVFEKMVFTGFQQGMSSKTSMNIQGYSLERIEEKAPFNLSDALARLPGVSQMTTGNAISKPVIRGLYGNRVLILLSGLRFDNQQWQDEHGLGLSQIGIDRVELVKGPASLLYGSDAIGGVINIIEEVPLEQGRKTDVGTRLFSNTLGTLTDIGIRNRNGKNWWRFRVGFENHADYSDGKNNRVLNSRNRGYYLKTGFGFEKGKWKQENSYNFSYNQYGFILEELGSFFDADARWVRSMNGPHHNVILNLFNSMNTFTLKKSVLKLNAGVQSNLRMEDEGGGQISLNMHLLSFLQNAKWDRNLSDKLSLVVNQQLTFTSNINYGGRIIIPDANMLESNLAAYVRYQVSRKFILEGGAGLNQKHIRTFLTRTLNAPGEPIRPFTKNNITSNGMIGMVWQPHRQVSVKQNNSTGFRAPNLAELSSNGLHEGVYRYEIGDPGMKVEQNINSDLTLELDKKHLFFSVSAYHNYFVNYIYLAPTANDSFFHFPVYLFKQKNARITGGEAYLVYRPKFMKFMQLKESVTITKGVLGTGENLPFIPAYKSSTAIRFEKKARGGLSTFFAEPEFIYVLAQNSPAQFETKTPSYYLVNLGAGISISKPGNRDMLRISLNVTNLTNTVYFDHLSRLKNFGLYNQGRNVVLSIRKQF
jgi:iron complex outermembrane receptor protein